MTESSRHNHFFFTFQAIFAPHNGNLSFCRLGGIQEGGLGLGSTGMYTIKQSSLYYYECLVLNNSALLGRSEILIAMCRVIFLFFFQGTRILLGNLEEGRPTCVKIVLPHHIMLPCKFGQTSVSNWAIFLTIGVLIKCPTLSPI